jgi:hypothetical protein
LRRVSFSYCIVPLLPYGAYVSKFSLCALCTAGIGKICSPA